MVQSKAQTVADYLAELPEDRRAVVSAVRDRVNAVLPDGYQENMAWGMIGWSVPMEVSGPTYNGQPLGYVSLAAQKRHYALYISCAYSDPERYARLEQAFKDKGFKFDMGKSCLRFTDPEKVAWEAVEAELASLTPEEFVALSEEARKSGRC